MADSLLPSATGIAPQTGLLLSVRHLTRFTYFSPVTDSFNETRLRPVTEELQTCIQFSLRVEPDATLRDYQDLYHNTVHFFDVANQHDHLDVEAVSLVQTHPDLRPTPGFRPPSALADPSLSLLCFDFLAPTKFVPLEEPLFREAQTVLGGGARDLWADALRLGEHVHDRVCYSPNSTRVSTRVLDVLQSRQGVCQDFAHLHLGLCRAVGIPARYVSGYFFNPVRPPGQSEASHAWVEIFLPAHGWRGYDPTHRREPDLNYVKLANGRDYGDIRPVNGTFRGTGTREMSVAVQVRKA